LLKFANLFFQFLKSHQVALTAVFLLVICHLLLEPVNLSLLLLFGPLKIDVVSHHTFFLFANLCYLSFTPRFFDCEVLLVLGQFSYLALKKAKLVFRFFFFCNLFTMLQVLDLI